MHLDLEVEALKQLDPLSILNKIIAIFPKIETKRSEVYTILAELCSNALDHGILRLDSSLKSSISGMATYYEDRAKKLAALKEGFIRIDIELKSNERELSGGVLSITVEDSGPGFSYQKKIEELKNPNEAGLRKLSGRGLSLMSSLCQSVEYNRRGNKVSIIYVWDTQYK
jgi:anti-sigma regulatory factor (Ser/Thr protein kinase)